jgi:putative ABC transport system permease protein
MNAIFNIALKNLRRNKIRTTLTICGTAIGLSLFIALMTISQSVKFQIRHLIDSYGIDIAIQAGGAPNPISSRIAVENIDLLSRIEGVSSASGFVVGSKRLPWNHYFVLLGANATDSVLSRFPIVRGHIFSNSAKEMIIGSLLAQKRGLQVNDTFNLDRHGDFLITGIFNTGSRVFDGAALMGLPVAQQVLQRGEDVNLIMVRLVEGYPLKTTIRSIQESFPHLEVMRGFDFISQIRVFRTVNTFAEAVALISLIACCITVTDTLLMAIAERTKEIGILMTIGWSQWQVVWTILSESILICMLGSILGSFLGTLFLWIMNNSRMLGIGWVPVWPPFEIIGMAVALGMVMGCLSAVYPGVVALHMLPADALRFEK